MLFGHCAAAPVPIDDSGYFRAPCVEAGTQSHAPIKPRRIRRQRDGRSDLAKLIGLLVEVRVDAMVSQCEREREAADASRRWRSSDPAVLWGVSDIQAVCLGRHGMRIVLKSNACAVSEFLALFVHFTIKWSEVDLTLLLLVQRLMQERRVSTVAEQMNMSQPGVSNSLAARRATSAFAI
jgi:hypothetical protein